jgi:hypothetical protein
MRKLLALILGFSFGVAAANNDDGFVWIDANTRIKVVKPVSAAAGETKAPEEAKAPQEAKEKKPEKSRK